MALSHDDSTVNIVICIITIITVNRLINWPQNFSVAASHAWNMLSTDQLLKLMLVLL